MLVADYLHIGAVAAQHSWDGLYLDSSLKFIHIDSGSFDHFFIQFLEGLEISQNQTLEVRVEFIGGQSLLMKQFDGFLSN